MKTRNLFTTAALICAATAFTACNVKDKINDPNNQPVRFAAGIDKQTAAQSRAAETTWASGDAIGIFMTQGASTLAANKKYSTTDGSAFTPVTGNEMYYPMNGSTVDFIAYYPFESGATLDAPIDVVIATAQTAANQPTFDLLYSDNGTGSKSSGIAPVTLTFEHKLAKIVMNCAADASVGSPLTGMTVAIKGMNTENTFDLETGTLGTASAPAAIAPRTVADGSDYDAIIMPDTYAAGVVSVEFTLADGSGDTFTWDLGAVSFEGGNAYTYDVTLTRTEVQVTGTISPWVGNARGAVTAE